MSNIFLTATLGIFSLFTMGCSNSSNSTNENYEPIITDVPDDQLKNVDTATFAGGCFWCTEASFERIKGVKKVVSGYSGGEEKNPSYSQVSAGRTGHAEAIQIFYDPGEITFEELLQVFFVAHDPTQLNRQGPDVGEQYRSAIFYHNENQRIAAQNFIDQQSRANIFKAPIVTELSLYTGFYEAEGYHQDYYAKNPNDRYIENVSKPKVEKVEKQFKDKLKKEYK